MSEQVQFNDEQLGSVEQRAPYYEASLGRQVLDDSLQDMLEDVRSSFELIPVKTPGINYLAGTVIAPKTRFGIQPPGIPRMQPDEVAEFAVRKMQERHSLAESSAEPVSLGVQNLFVKRRRQKQKNVGYSLVAKVSDVPTDEYPLAGQILAEKAVVMRSFGEKALDLTTELELIEHHIPIATGTMEEFYFIKKYLKALPKFDQRTVTLAPIGYLHTPRPEYP